MTSCSYELFLVLLDEPPHSWQTSWERHWESICKRIQLGEVRMRSLVGSLYYQINDWRQLLDLHPCGQSLHHRRWTMLSAVGASCKPLVTNLTYHNYSRRFVWTVEFGLQVSRTVSRDALSSEWKNERARERTRSITSLNRCAEMQTNQLN